MGEHQCPYCGRFFPPDFHGEAQRQCGRPACRRAHRRETLRRWRSLHPEHKERYAAQERAWAKAWPDYWRERRRKNRAYAVRDNRRRVDGRRRGKKSANETMLRNILVEKVRALDRVGVSANETGLLRRMDAFEECLRSTAAVALSANETGLAAATRPGG